MRRLHFNLVLAGSAFALSIASLAVVVHNASNEPFFVLRAPDALVQVGVAIVLILLWVGLALGLIVGVSRRRISVWWLLLVLWMVTCEAYLIDNIRGYVQDITQNPP